MWLATLIFAEALAMPAADSQCPQQPTSLAAMGGCYRVLLVFASSSADPQFQAQMEQLAGDLAGLRERDLLIVPVLAKGATYTLSHPLPVAILPEVQAAEARQRYSYGRRFETVLLGKDGGRKLQSAEPISRASLYDTIDSMPMRQQEMQQRR